ncbi:MAG TPA: aldose 1-epimerase family protein [Kribbella sp.]|nr:aldose 1-epimerase family protein [Kribbella sp.]
MNERVAPSGEQWSISAGEYRGTVVSVGGGLRGLSYGNREVLIGYDKKESAHAGIGQHLFPWPNRIADGRYTFAGTEQQLSLTEPTRRNAIHGLTRWANWNRLDDGSSESVVVVGYRLHGEPGYPHQLDLTVRYELDAVAGLTVEATAENIGSDEAPYGFGSHPYLTVGRQLDECEVRFTAGQRLDVTPDRLLPVGLVEVAASEFDFGKPRTVGGLFIDNAFTALPDRWTVQLTDPASGRGAELSSDTPWMQLFTGDAIGRAGLAVEPMTCPPNAFVTGENLITLAPGESHTTRFSVNAN